MRKEKIKRIIKKRKKEYNPKYLKKLQKKASKWIKNIDVIEFLNTLRGRN
jgi:hypothetical protein